MEFGFGNWFVTSSFVYIWILLIYATSHFNFNLKAVYIKWVSGIIFFCSLLRLPQFVVLLLETQIWKSLKKLKSENFKLKHRISNYSISSDWKWSPVFQIKVRKSILHLQTQLKCMIELARKFFFKRKVKNYLYVLTFIDDES